MSRWKFRRNPEPDETELDYEYGEWIPAAAVRFNEDGTVSLLGRETNRGRRRNAVSRVVQTIQQQLLDQGIRDEVRGRVDFVAWDENTLKVSRGEDGVLISYDRARDLYDVEEYHGLEREPLREGVYADSLMDVIVPVLTGRRR